MKNSTVKPTRKIFNQADNRSSIKRLKFIGLTGLLGIMLISSTVFSGFSALDPASFAIFSSPSSSSSYSSHYLALAQEDGDGGDGSGSGDVTEEEGTGGEDQSEDESNNAGGGVESQPEPETTQPQPEPETTQPQPEPSSPPDVIVDVPPTGQIGEIMSGAAESGNTTTASGGTGTGGVAQQNTTASGVGTIPPGTSSFYCPPGGYEIDPSGNPRPCPPSQPPVQQSTTVDPADYYPGYECNTPNRQCIPIEGKGVVFEHGSLTGLYAVKSNVAMNPNGVPDTDILLEKKDSNTQTTAQIGVSVQNLPPEVDTIEKAANYLLNYKHFNGQFVVPDTTVKFSRTVDPQGAYNINRSPGYYIEYEEMVCKAPPEFCSDATYYHKEKVRKEFSLKDGKINVITVRVGPYSPYLEGSIAAGYSTDPFEQEKRNASMVSRTLIPVDSPIAWAGPERFRRGK